MIAIVPPVMQGLFGTKLKMRKNKKHDAMTISTMYGHGQNGPLAVLIKSQFSQCSKEPVGLQIAVDEAMVAIVNKLEWVRVHCNGMSSYLDNSYRNMY